MKKVFLSLLLSCLTLSAGAAVSFSDAFADNSKPFAVLLYADWAPNYQDALLQFRLAQATMGDTYNYVELNIADEDTRAYNALYTIVPGMPYIMLYKTSGKISRYLDRRCTFDTSCVVSKMTTFVR